MLQLPSAHIAPSMQEPAASMQAAVELVQVPSAQRTWDGGAQPPSSVAHPAIVARHSSWPSGPHRTGSLASHGHWLSCSRRWVAEH